MGYDIRLSKCSPTRMALAMAVRAGAHDDHVIVLSHIPIMEAPRRAGLTRSG